MTTNIISGGSPTNGPGALAQKLTALADKAQLAAVDISPNYLVAPGATPADDFAAGARSAHEVRVGVDHLKDEIAIHAGSEGLTAADHAIGSLDQGLSQLVSGVVAAEPHPGAGAMTAILDEHAPKAASELFKSAAASLRGVAELAQFGHLGGLEPGVLDDAIRRGLRLL